MVVGDVDSHLFVDGGFVCGVGAGECGGDVPEAGYQGFDVVLGECGGGFDTEKGFEAPTLLGGFGNPSSYRCCCVGFVTDNGAVAVEFAVEGGDLFADFVASGLVFGIGLGGSIAAAEISIVLAESREISLRMSMGATRAGIATLLMIETVVVTGIATSAGTILGLIAFLG